MWEGQLAYVEEGNNIIPTIHISDLSRWIQSLINIRPNMNYLIATDYSQNTQKEIIECFAKELGAK